MEEQTRKERAEATKTSEHQLQSIMSELRALKKKHEKDTKERKVDEKNLLENIKASIDPILKPDYKSDHIGVGARLKHLQDEVTNYLPPTVNKKTWSSGVDPGGPWGPGPPLWSNFEAPVEFLNKSLA